MRICYDYQTFTNQKVGGISRYFKYLIDGVRNSPEDDVLLAILFSNNIYLEERDLPSKLKHLKFLFSSHRKTLKRNKNYAKKIISNNNFDIFHPTYFDPYYIQHVNKPTIVTVHDMTYEALPHLFPTTDPTPYHKRLVMEKADKLIAISEKTKEDILRYTSIPEKKIEVIHHGINLTSPEYEEVQHIPKDYILFVGGRWSYKNFFLLVDAFEKISQKNPNLYLVLAGGGNLAYGDTEYLLRKKILEKTVHINPTDKQLNTLYKNAKCFVYPSSYEGFGFPILEAFSNNCPILLSNIDCFKEVAREAVNYFENGNLDSLVYSLENILAGHKINTSSNLDRLKQFDIKHCVNKTIETYHSLC